MIEHIRAAWLTRGGQNGSASRAGGRGHRRRWSPRGEALELRDCPSAMAPQAGPDRAEVAKDHTSDHHRTALVAHHDVLESHVALKTKARAKAKTGAQVIYVAPKGKTSLTAGKNAAHPLGSLTLALKRAKPGATIILAPGTYTQNAGMMSKSDITIIGAANQSSILAGAGQALKIYASSGITIDNVWFRSSASGGIGLAIAGSSVTVNNIKTDGTYGDGVVVTSYNGQNGVLNATSSQFDGSQTGDGLHLEAGSSATISACTFNGNGTAANVPQSSNGLVLESGTSANVTDSQFNDNYNGGLVASGNSQITVQSSTISGNKNSDGAIFLDQATVNLTGDTFASNGQVVGITSGLNGLEFLGAAGNPDNYTGTAVVTGNSFLNNTANGIFVGSAGNLTVSNNTFSGNVVGIFFDGTGASINTTVTGNTIEVAPNPPDDWNGIVVQGTGLTATIGGSGASANTIENYDYGDYIHEAFGSGPNSGLPNVSILGNNYIQNGSPVASSYAIYVQ